MMCWLFYENLDFPNQRILILLLKDIVLKFFLYLQGLHFHLKYRIQDELFETLDEIQLFQIPQFYH